MATKMPLNQFCVKILQYAVGIGRRAAQFVGGGEVREKGGVESASNAIGITNMLMHLDAVQVGIWAVLAAAGPTYSLTDGF